MLVPGKSLVPQTQHREFSRGKQDMPIPYPPHCGALAIPQSLAEDKRLLNKSLNSGCPSAGELGSLTVGFRRSRGSAIGLRLFGLIAEPVFAFIPESCSGAPGTPVGIIPESRSSCPEFPKG